MRLTTTMVLFTSLLASAAPAVAQIKPAASGDPSFREPEMRRHGSGFVRPNRAHHRRLYRAHRFY